MIDFSDGSNSQAGGTDYELNLVALLALLLLSLPLSILVCDCQVGEAGEVRRFGQVLHDLGHRCQVIGATKEAGLIKADDSDSSSTRYARYLPSWA